MLAFSLQLWQEVERQANMSGAEEPTKAGSLWIHNIEMLRMDKDENDQPLPQTAVQLAVTFEQPNNPGEKVVEIAMPLSAWNQFVSVLQRVE